MSNKLEPSKVFFSDFKKKVAKEYDNWDKAYIAYFQFDEDEHDEAYLPKPWPEIINEAAFDQALYEGLYSFIVEPPVRGKCYARELPPKFRSEGDLIVKLCAYAPEITDGLHKDLKESIDFWHAVCEVSGAAMMALTHTSMSSYKDVKCALFLNDNKAFLAKTLDALPESDRSRFFNYIKHDVGWRASDNAPGTVTAELNAFYQTWKNQKALLRSLETYIQTLEQGSFSASLKYSLFGGYTQASRLGAARALKDYFEKNLKGESENKVIAAWCLDMLNEGDLASVIDAWEQSDTSRQVLFGSLLFSVVTAVVCALATLSSPAALALPMIAALSLVTSAVYANDYEMPEIQSAVTLGHA